MTKRRYHFSWIDEGRLAASNLPRDLDDLTLLHGRGIRAILTLTETPLTEQIDIPLSWFADRDLLLHHIPLPDHHPPTLAQAREILAWLALMDYARRPVLVHCHGGRGRTGTILHLIYQSRGLSLIEARAVITARRFLSTRLTDFQLAFLKQIDRQPDLLKAADQP